MTKAALRKIYREKKNQLTTQEIEKLNDLILINFQKIPLPFIKYVHTYMASERLIEADTGTIVRYLTFKNPGLKILVPKIDLASENLHHLHFDEDVEWVHNAFGIPEPLLGTLTDPGEIDLVLVPLLAFDKNGSRVGYGKGHYDKFLSQCRDDVIKIGLSFFDPADQIDDINQFDISLNYCVTPHQVFEF